MCACVSVHARSCSNTLVGPTFGTFALICIYIYYKFCNEKLSLPRLRYSMTLTQEGGSI